MTPPPVADPHVLRLEVPGDPPAPEISPDTAPEPDVPAEPAPAYEPAPEGPEPEQPVIDTELPTTPDNPPAASRAALTF